MFECRQDAEGAQCFIKSLLALRLEVLGKVAKLLEEQHQVSLLGRLQALVHQLHKHCREELVVLLQIVRLAKVESINENKLT